MGKLGGEAFISDRGGLYVLGAMTMRGTPRSSSHRGPSDDPEEDKTNDEDRQKERPGAFNLNDASERRSGFLHPVQSK